eukprot:scaffold64090_cov17-Prasinocladus_malaysianus.AAC.1
MTFKIEDRSGSICMMYSEAANRAFKRCSPHWAALSASSNSPDLYQVLRTTGLNMLNNIGLDDRSWLLATDIVITACYMQPATCI